MRASFGLGGQVVVGKNAYERRKARLAKPVPAATYRELELVVLKRAADFCEKYMQTDGWSRECERRAFMLNLAVERLQARKVTPEDRCKHGVIMVPGYHCPHCKPYDAKAHSECYP